MKSISLQQLGWIAIVLELVLFIIWLIAAFGPGQHTDAAGKGLAAFYIIVFGAYILASIVLLLVNNKYCTVLVLLMFALPLLIAIIGFFRR
jgi:hypothetical protein